MNPTAGLALLLAAALAAADVSAQPRRPLSLEANVGPNFGFSRADHLGNDVGPNADLLLAFRPRPFAPRGLVLGAAANVHGSGPYETICRLTPDGGCVPHFPTFFAYAAYAGLENGDATLRILAGPAWVRTDEFQSTTAVQARLDVTGWLFGPVGAGVSVRPAWVPRYRGRSYYLFALGMGLRLR